jgi:hypothetical protein
MACMHLYEIKRILLYIMMKKISSRFGLQPLTARPVPRRVAATQGEEFRRAKASTMSDSGFKRSMDGEPRPIVVTLAAGIAMLYGVVASGAAVVAITVLGLAHGQYAFHQLFYQLIEYAFPQPFSGLAQPISDLATLPILILILGLITMALLFAVVGGMSAGIFLAGLAAWRRKPWARWPLIVAYFVGGVGFALISSGNSEMLAAAAINVAAAVGLLTKAAARWYESSR